MSQQWSPELKVDQDLASHLIEHQFPELKPLHLKLLGEGWDNTVYQANEDYVFRFPRRKVAVELISTEAKILPKLAHQLPLPIPEPIFFGKPQDPYPWPFLGYHMLHGQSACKANLSKEERIALAKPIAKFLKTLHSIDESQALELGGEFDKMGRLDISLRWPRVHEMLGKIHELELYPHVDKLYELLDSLKEVQETNKRTLVHGDFYVRHLLVNQKRELCGVIDWGDCHVGNPAVDLLILYSFLPIDAHEEFFNVYGEAGGQTLRLAMFRVLLSCCYIILFGHDIKDGDLVREGLWGFGNLVACFLLHQSMLSHTLPNASAEAIATFKLCT